jgi:hypothetical protein
MVPGKVIGEASIVPAKRHTAESKSNDFFMCFTTFLI